MCPYSWVGFLVRNCASAGAVAEIVETVAEH